MKTFKEYWEDTYDVPQGTTADSYLDAVAGAFVSYVDEVIAPDERRRHPSDSAVLQAEIGLTPLMKSEIERLTTRADELLAANNLLVEENRRLTNAHDNWRSFAIEQEASNELQTRRADRLKRNVNRYRKLYYRGAHKIEERASSLDGFLKRALGLITMVHSDDLTPIARHALDSLKRDMARYYERNK